MTSYKNDPRWITARYPGKCTAKDCGAPIPKGASVYYYPSTKSIYCFDCGQGLKADFDASVWDEEQYATY